MNMTAGQKNRHDTMAAMHKITWQKLQTQSNWKTSWRGFTLQQTALFF